ncbi:MAG: helix-turn-helix transcriptional regulator [Coriobacteriales bacterium]|nr:helix-turn-helix transcriptional regulator [Coriobacteriales bacterium]
MPRKPDIELLRRLAGEISPEQLRFVDSYASEGIGVFMPVGGACAMALTPEHTHPSYMFVLNFDDRTEVRLRGSIAPGQPGRVYSLLPSVPHQELPAEEPPRYIAVMIEPELLEGELAEYDDVSRSDFDDAFHDAHRELLPALRRFMIEADNAGPGSSRVLRGLAVQICHCLIRAARGSQASNDAVSSRIDIDRAIQHMSQNLSEKLLVAELAAVANMSPSHFSRVFREEVGRSPGDYLRNLRLDRAKRLLLAGDAPLTRVAHECGLGSGAYLSACFKERFNVTPSEYRERARRL